MAEELQFRTSQFWRTIGKSYKGKVFLLGLSRKLGRVVENKSFWRARVQGCGGFSLAIRVRTLSLL